MRKLRKEVAAIITSKTKVPAKNFVPYTYGEIREIYMGFAGQKDELRILMDFTALKRADAKFLLDNLKNDIARRKAS